MIEMHCGHPDAVPVFRGQGEDIVPEARIPVVGAVVVKGDDHGPARSQQAPV